MRRGSLRGGEDAVEIGLGVAEGNVARDRFVEDVILLQDHPDVPPNVAVVERLQIGVVEQNCSFRRFEQTGDELDQGCFSATAPAHECDHPAGRDVESNIR